jgi:hypothetical protein
VQADGFRVVHERVQLVQVEVRELTALEIDEHLLFGVEASKSILELSKGCVSVGRKRGEVYEIKHGCGGAHNPWIASVHNSNKSLLHVLMLRAICLREF